MIQITAYLRDEKDLAKWKALANKTDFLHKALNGSSGAGGSVKPKELSYLDNKCPVHNTTLALAGHCMVLGCEYGEKNGAGRTTK